VPRALQELQLRVVNARADLTNELGRAPGVPEIAAAVDASEEAVVASVLSANARRGRSFDEPIGDDITLADSLGAVDPEIECAEMRVLIGSAWGVLCERDQKVLRLRYTDDLSQTDIGRLLGISQMQVSRLIHHSLALLRFRMERPLPRKTTAAEYRLAA
jgi:RNA polymerase sigma-B factor